MWVILFNEIRTVVYICKTAIWWWGGIEQISHSIIPPSRGWCRRRTWKTPVKAASQRKQAWSLEYRDLISKGVPLYKSSDAGVTGFDDAGVQELIRKFLVLELSDRATLQHEIRQEANKTFSRRYNTPYEETIRNVMNPKTVGLWRLKILEHLQRLSLHGIEANMDEIIRSLWQQRLAAYLFGREWTCCDGGGRG